ncbi:MAG: hypothetical protein SOZ59_05615 [Candidatus Limivivens sp.]|nr:hypothetical protein [Candidatus Limivivens sp.]
MDDRIIIDLSAPVLFYGKKQEIGNRPVVILRQMCYSKYEYIGFEVTVRNHMPVSLPEQRLEGDFRREWDGEEWTEGGKDL